MATKSATKSKTASKSTTATTAKSPRTKLSIVEVKEPKEIIMEKEVIVENVEAIEVEAIEVEAKVEEIKVEAKVKDTSSASLRANKGKIVEPKAEKAPKAPKEPKTPKEAVGPAIEIISALYGIEGTRIEMAEVKAGRKLSNKMAGSDPAPKTAKDAIIIAKVDGKEVTVTVKEGEVIAFV